MAVVLDGIAYGLQLAVLAAIATSVLMGSGVPTLWAVLAGVAIGAVLALAVDASLMRPVYRLRGEARVLLSLLLTIGLAFVIDGLLVSYYTNSALRLSVSGPAVTVLGVAMRRGSLVASVVALVALGALI